MFSFMPHDTEFYDMFEKAALIVLDAATTYAKLASDFPNKDGYINQIRKIEHDGDDVIHRTLDKLDKTFVAPFDREDIQELMRQLDDVIDEIDAAAKRLILYRIPTPSKWFQLQTDVLKQACELLVECMHKLRQIKKADSLHASLVEIHRLENLGDENNHAAIAELYNESNDPFLVMKWKEIYDLTERAIDRCEDIAIVIERIVLKHS